MTPAERAEFDALKRQVKALRQHRTRMDHWEDTLRSRWWLRAWWWLQGFRLNSLGRWYRARWNESAAKYEQEN